jgi:hypothetical protein
MTEPPLSHTQSDAMLNHFPADGLEGLRGAIGLLINAAMKIERSQHLQATANERTDQRLGFTNGFKPRTLLLKGICFSRVASLAGPGNGGSGGLLYGLIRRNQVVGQHGERQNSQRPKPR